MIGFFGLLILMFALVFFVIAAKWQPAEPQRGALVCWGLACMAASAILFYAPGIIEHWNH